MLKKHSKLVVLFVIATFLFSFVASAGATTFTDVSGSSAEAAAIYKLNSLGIIDGYPDGTFGADNTITRAEFAKIAVYTAGLQNVATGMKASPSTFKDVATSEWYNGWVNVAAAQGYVKGYSDGCFYPNKEVTQAEAVTVLLRILGYNDNLPGNWPSDYIGKAANLGILDDVTFDAYGSATRGTVCTMAGEALDQNVVSYVASDNYFSETATGPAKTLLATKFKDWGNVIEEQLVTDVNLTDGKIKFTFKDMADFGTAKDDSGSKELAANCVFANADFWGGAAFRFVDYVLNDDGDVAYIKVLDYKVIKNVAMDDITLKTAWASLTSPGEIKVDDKTTYKIAKNFNADNSDPQGAAVTDATKGALGITGFLSAATAGETLESHFINHWGLYGDGADLVLNDDGEVAYVRGFAYPGIAPTGNLLTPAAINMPGTKLIRSVGIVDQTVAKSGKITLVSGGGRSIVLDPDENGYYITRNGAPAKFADIKKGDLIYCVDKFGLSPAVNTADGGFIIAMDVTAKGKLTSYEKNGDTLDTVKKVVVGDKTYTIACGSAQNGNVGANPAVGAAVVAATSYKSAAIISDDNGESFNPLDSAAADDVLGNEVTVYLNAIGEVAAIVTGAGESDAGKIYGVINDVGQTLSNGKIQDSIEVLKADGTFATYTYDEDSALNAGAEGSLDASEIPGGIVVAVAPAVDPDTLQKGLFVEVTLNAKGFIDKVKTTGITGMLSDNALVTPADDITGDKDNKSVTWKGNTYDASKVVVFDINAIAAGDDADLVSAADFIDDADGTLTAAADFTGTLVIKAKDGRLQYVAIDSAAGIGGKGNLAMVAGTGHDTDGDYAQFLQKDGTTKKVYLDTGAALAGKSKLIYYDMSNEEADITDWSAAPASAWECTGNTLTVNKVSGNIITFTSGAQYAVDADTLYFDCSDDDPAAAELADIANGDIVKVYKDAGEAIGAIVLQ